MAIKKIGRRKRVVRTVNVPHLWMTHVYGGLRKTVPDTVECQPSPPSLSAGSLPSSGSDINEQDSDEGQAKIQSDYRDVATQVDETALAHGNKKREVQDDVDQQVESEISPLCRPMLTNSYIVCKVLEMMMAESSTNSSETRGSSEDSIQMVPTIESYITDSKGMDFMSEILGMSVVENSSSTEIQCSAEDSVQMATATESDITKPEEVDPISKNLDVIAQESSPNNTETQVSAEDSVQMATTTESDITKPEKVDPISKNQDVIAQESSPNNTETQVSAEDSVQMATTTESDITKPEKVDPISKNLDVIAQESSPNNTETQVSAEDSVQMATTTESDITKLEEVDPISKNLDIIAPEGAPYNTETQVSAEDSFQMATKFDNTERQEMDTTPLKCSHKKPMAHTFRTAAEPESSEITRSKITLDQSLSLLSLDSWEKKITGLNAISGLLQGCPDAVGGKLRQTNLAVIHEVMNLRSVVCRTAVRTLGEMYRHLQKKMDRELEITAKALLQRLSTANEFIRQDIDAALASMVQHCTPSSVIKALLAGGQGHLSSVVRACTGQHLQSLLLRTGAAYALSDAKDVTKCVLQAIALLALDPSQEARRAGSQMAKFLASHDNFNAMATKHLTSKDVCELQAIIHKETANTLSRSPTERKAHLLGCGMNKSTAKMRIHSQAEKEEYTRSLKAQMASTDFRMRMKAIDMLISDCEQRPSLVLACKFPVFDALVDRLQESNRKINQLTLEALQKTVPLLKDGMGPVLNILVPAIVDNHLNCKMEVIHKATVGALDALIEHLDNALLLDVLCIKAQNVSGNAKGHLIQKLSVIVTNVYMRKPQTVEKRILPLLWKQLVSASNREQTTALCRAVYIQMGQQLRESAATQPIGVIEALNKRLRTF